MKEATSDWSALVGAPSVEIPAHVPISSELPPAAAPLMPDAATPAPAPSQAPARGSLNRPFKLAIIGGGPAGVAVLVRAIRVGQLDKLLGPDAANGAAEGVLLLESGPPERLGGGKLAQYHINSNTNAQKFVKHILSDRPEVIPEERATGTVLEPLRSSAAVQELERAGEGIAPLELIGAVLAEVGQVVRSVLDQHEQSCCLCETTVESVQITDSGVLRICTSRYPIHAAKAVLATGGCQPLPVRPPSLCPPLAPFSRRHLTRDHHAI